MKKIICFCFIFGLFVNYIYSQEVHVIEARITFTSEYEKENVIIARKNEGSWNYTYALLNYKTGKEITPFIFEKMELLVEKKYLLVKIGQQYGVIDFFGKYFLPCVYDGISLISYEGINYLNVTKNGKSGIIDFKKISILPTEYDEITKQYNSNYFILKRGNTIEIKDIFTNKIYISGPYEKLEIIDSRSGECFLVKKNGKYNVIDISGKELFDKWYDYMSYSSYYYNGFKVALNDKSGILSETGTTILPLEYDEISDMNFQGKPCLSICKENKRGISDLLGNIIIPIKYKNLNVVSANDSILIASKDEKYGVIGNKDQIIIPFAYKSITGYQSDKVFLVQSDSTYGLFDFSGKNIIPLKYKNLSPLKKQDGRDNCYYIIGTDNEMGIMNSKGDICIKPEYALIPKKPSLYSNHYDYPFIAKNKKGMYGILDLEGTEILPFEYDNIIFLNSFLRIVCQKGKYGIIDVFSKDVILPIKYEFIAYGDQKITTFKDNKYEFYRVFENTLGKK